MAKRILLAGGASGGHAFPLVAIARALKEQARQKNIEVELMFIGDVSLLESAGQAEGIVFKRIYGGKLRRYISPLVLLDAAKILLGFIQTLWHLFWFMPDVVFTKGGYDSVMPGLIARLYRISLLIHESDAVPGLGNRILGKFAAVIFLSFQSAASFFKNGKTVVVGNPIRSELLGGDSMAGLSAFQLASGRKTVLVMGGSQGARQINELILEALPLLAKELQIVHQCGPKQYAFVEAERKRLIEEGKENYGQAIQQSYRVFPFLDTKQLAMAYAVCDVVISRAGAGSLFEIAALGKPAIIIPIEGSANGHQAANASEFAKAGAVVMAGSNLTTHLLLNQIRELLDPAHALEISQSIKAFAAPHAADDIATVILGG